MTDPQLTLHDQPTARVYSRLFPEGRGWRWVAHNRGVERTGTCSSQQAASAQRHAAEVELARQVAGLLGDGAYVSDRLRTGQEA